MSVLDPLSTVHRACTKFWSRLSADCRGESNQAIPHGRAPANQGNQ